MIIFNHEYKIINEKLFHLEFQSLNFPFVKSKMDAKYTYDFHALAWNFQTKKMAKADEALPSVRYIFNFVEIDRRTIDHRINKTSEKPATLCWVFPGKIRPRGAFLPPGGNAFLQTITSQPATPVGWLAGKCIDRIVFLNTLYTMWSTKTGDCDGREK